MGRLKMTWRFKNSAACADYFDIESAELCLAISFNETNVVNYREKIMATFDSLINTEKPVLVDFFAAWCGPCHALAPILQQVKEALGDEISIIKIDIDKNPEVASRFQVRGVPTMILFRNGKKLWRESGALPKDAILYAIKKHTQ
jgi:thioredoxin 1